MKGITLISENAELTAVQAANILNVSRLFLIRLLEDGHISYRKVGKHRRIRVEDVMNYKQAIDRERESVLDQLVADAQEQDIGYEWDEPLLDAIGCQFIFLSLVSNFSGPLH